MANTLLPPVVHKSTAPLPQVSPNPRSWHHHSSRDPELHITVALQAHCPDRKTVTHASLPVGPQVTSCLLRPSLASDPCLTSVIAPDLPHLNLACYVASRLVCLPPPSSWLPCYCQCIPPGLLPLCHPFLSPGPARARVTSCLLGLPRPLSFSKSDI